MGRETARIALPLELLDTPGRPAAGWQAGTEEGRAAIVAAAALLFGPLGTVARAAAEGDRLRAELRADRRPAEASALLARAARQVDAGRGAEARETLLAAVRADPASPRAHYNLGVLALGGGDLDAAAEALSRAAGLGYRPPAHAALGLGNVARRRGDIARARALFERALALEPGDATAARNLGVVLGDLGEHEGAIAMFRRSLAAEPGSAPSHLGLGMELALAGRREEAAASLRRAADLAGGRGPLAELALAELRRLDGRAETTPEPEPSGHRPGPPTGAASTMAPGGGPALLPATEALLEEVRRLTGHGFAFEARADLPTLARVQVARGGMREHRILYHPDVASLDHLVAHEAGHLVRLWGVPGAARLLPAHGAAEQVGAITQLGGELAAMANAGIPPDVLYGLFRRIYPGLVHQVANVPADLRIERWIREGHPGLRAAQRASLVAQLELNRRVLAPEVAGAMPPTIYAASCALGCAFARGVAALLGEPALAGPYRDTPHWAAADPLLGALGEVPDDAAGDVAATDRWAGLLGMRGWYHWARLDSLGPAE